MRHLSKSQKIGLLVLTVVVGVFTLLPTPRMALAEPPGIDPGPGSGSEQQPEPDAAVASADEAEKICQASHSLSWILCPLIFGGSQIGDVTHSFAGNFLVLNVDNFGEGTKKVWGTFRDIANIGFVIIFLIVIFSHLTGVGINAYHIKKIFPKLIVSVILINLSFFITQILVEISNIIGSSITGLFTRIAEELAESSPSTAPTGFALGNTIAAVLVALAAGATAFAASNATVSFFLQFLVPIILFIIVTLIVTVFILVARQAIVIFLAVLSPLAFLSTITPNTESLFQTWKKVLIGVLTTYPIIGLIFGAAGLAGSLLTSVSGGNWLLWIMAQMIHVIPLVAIPPAIKNSIAAVPMIGGKIAGLANKLQKKTWGAARKSPLSSRFKASHESQLRRRKLQRFSDQKADGTEKSRFGRGLAGMRRKVFSEQEAQLQRGIASEAQGMAGAMTDNDAQILANLGDGELTKEHLSQMSAGVRASFYSSGKNEAMLHMAAAEHLASKGRLRADQYQSFVQRAAQSKGYTNQMAFDSSNRILDSAKAKGAYDTAAYINNINQTGGDFRTGTRNGLTEEVAESYLDQLSADDLAKTSAGALATGSATANAFVRRLSDSDFVNTLHTAINSGNMNAETYNQIGVLSEQFRENLRQQRGG